MNPNWAEESLKTIRTLMERSALYRRALAPIMLFTGAIGVLAAGAGLRFKMQEPGNSRNYGLARLLWLWLALSCWRAAKPWKDQEPFWSPPTRRVGQAVLPPLLCGLFAGAVLAMPDSDWKMDFSMVVDLDVVLRLRAEFRRFFHEPRHQMVRLDIHFKRAGTCFCSAAAELNFAAR